MVLLLAIVTAAATPPIARPVGATVQARATVRVLSGVQLKLGHESQNRDGFIMRETSVHSAGVEQPATLIEFQ